MGISPKSTSEIPALARSNNIKTVQYHTQIKFSLSVYNVRRKCMALFAPEKYTCKSKSQIKHHPLSMCALFSIIIKLSAGSACGRPSLCHKLSRALGGVAGTTMARIIWKKIIPPTRAEVIVKRVAFKISADSHVRRAADTITQRSRQRLCRPIHAYIRHCA